MNQDNQSYSDTSLPWDLEELFQTPRSYPIPEMSEGRVEAVFIEGLPFEGRLTRNFAYYALPDMAPDTTVPAMVLVHGGGGTAFQEWVQLWVKRGYLAIAIDVEGHLPTEKTSTGERPQHVWSGPSRQGVFADFSLPMEEQWMYHAAAAVIQAHSFLRSMEQVDPSRVGLTGISWGGIIASLVAGVDQRFAFTIPVYGCGYLYEASNQYGHSFADMPLEQSEKIKKLWDPSAYFHRVSMPMLWLTWNDDPHFPLNVFSKSYLAARNEYRQSVMSIHFGLGHSHSNGWKREEIYTFADQMTRGGFQLPQITHLQKDEKQANAVYSSDMPLDKAELIHTSDISNWFEVSWDRSEAQIDRESNEIHAQMPEKTQAFFFQITDERGCIVSSSIYVNA